ncbi:MAG: hypothetical protein E6P95_00295 [Candidatus Moraniibacteriota bacterium]|nr:MAG: hypothetical protein E6P95_00295 [Candidatus Moranbacteria bacterium]
MSTSQQTGTRRYRNGVPTDHDRIIEAGIRWFNTLRATGVASNDFRLQNDPQLWVKPGGAGRIYEGYVSQGDYACGKVTITIDQDGRTLHFSFVLFD